MALGGLCHQRPGHKGRSGAEGDQHAQGHDQNDRAAALRGLIGMDHATTAALMRALRPLVLGIVWRCRRAHHRPSAPVIPFRLNRKETHFMTKISDLEERIEALEMRCTAMHDRAELLQSFLVAVISRLAPQEDCEALRQMIEAKIWTANKSMQISASSDLQDLLRAFETGIPRDL